MKEPTKGRTFEARLRLIAAPPPDPRARARAKDAALAEFERAHAAANEPIAPPAPGFWQRAMAWLAGSEAGAAARGGPPRTALLGAAAGVFVAVLGLLSIWPMLTGRQPVPTVDATAVRARPASPPAAAASSEAPRPLAAPAPAREELAEQAAAPQALGAQAGAEAPPAAVREADANPAAPAAPAAEHRQKAAQPGAAARADSAQGPAVATPAAPRDSIAALASSAHDTSEPANDAAGNEASSARLDDVVTGNRAAASDDASKRVPPVWDAIRAEELGSLPDTNVAESLQRRPALDADRTMLALDANPVRQTSDGAVSTFSVDVDTASYGAVRRRLEAGVLPRKELVRVEELINYFDYSWPQPATREEPFKPTVIVGDSPWSPGKKLVHIGIKGFALDARARPDASVIMLVDVSSSMAETGRVPVVQEAIRLMLASLKPTDTVGIVAYFSRNGARTGVVLEPTRVSERQKIWQAIGSLRPTRAAAPGTPAMKLAYDLATAHFRSDGVNRILLCTDGDFSAGMSPLPLKRLVERERENGIFLSVIGFGMPSYRGELAQSVALDGNGVVVNVTDAEAARRVMVEQATGTSFTIAKDVRFQVEFNPATVAEWRLVGYEAGGARRGESNESDVKAGDVGAGHTATAIYEITPVAPRAAADAATRLAATQPVKPGHAAHEYGHLRIRYKLPGGFRARVIEQAIGIEPLPLSETLRRDVAFSTAVAGFAQLLRGGHYTGGLTYADVERQAQAAAGDDPLGYRAEFVQLVRRAQRAARP
jgi:Ca-activated chloride channel homolog